MSELVFGGSEWTTTCVVRDLDGTCGGHRMDKGLMSAS